MALYPDDYYGLQQIYAKERTRQMQLAQQQLMGIPAPAWFESDMAAKKEETPNKKLLLCK